MTLAKNRAPDILSKKIRVRPGREPMDINVEDAAQVLTDVIAVELAKDNAWQPITAAQKIRAGAEPQPLDIAPFLNDECKALHIDTSKYADTLHLSEKLEAALIYSGVLRRTPKIHLSHAYNGGVISLPGECVVLVNETGKDQLEYFIAHHQQRTRGALHRC